MIISEEWQNAKRDNRMDTRGKVTKKWIDFTQDDTNKYGPQLEEIANTVDIRQKKFKEN